MTSWIAKYHSGDSPVDVFIGIQGQEYGFDVVTSDNRPRSALATETEAEALREIQNTYGGISSFQWLS